MLPIYLSMLDTNEEKDKFEEVYKTYKQTMFYVAYKILKDENIAEDAVHEAFIKIAKNLHKIFEISCPQTKSFVVIIVRNVSLSMLKKTSENIVSFDEYDETQQTGQIKDNSMFEKFEIDLIVREILKLPDIYKDVLNLECVSEFSIKEISRILGITYDTAKKRSQRGKKLLIENLKKEDFNYGK